MNMLNITADIKQVCALCVTTRASLKCAKISAEMRDKMNILIIDGQGGGLGKQIVSLCRTACPDAVLTAVGTNSQATSAMLKAGADHAATGENAVIVGCRKADVIIGPIGIVIADSLFGEITPKMSAAIGQSEAKRILIPMNRCETLVAGVFDQQSSDLLQHAMKLLTELEKK